MRFKNIGYCTQAGKALNTTQYVPVFVEAKRSGICLPRPCHPVEAFSIQLTKNQSRSGVDMT